MMAIAYIVLAALRDASSRYRWTNVSWNTAVKIARKSRANRVFTQTLRGYIDAQSYIYLRITGAIPERQTVAIRHYLWYVPRQKKMQSRLAILIHLSLGNDVSFVTYITVFGVICNLKLRPAHSYDEIHIWNIKNDTDPNRSHNEIDTILIW